MIDDELTMDRKDELVKILRPFFSQLSIYAFESTYASMASFDIEVTTGGLLKDLFDEKTIARSL